jgi:ComF family protein
VLTAAADAFVRTFFAPACAACDGVLRRPLASPVCEVCWRGVARLSPPLCVRCGDVLPFSGADGPECARCRERVPVLAVARSAGEYTGALRDILHAFKFHRRRALAAPLAELVKAEAGDVLAGADAVVPVPLHPLRALQRGFNQADDLARELGLPVWRDLRRRRHGPPQASLPATARPANVRRVFRAGFGCRRLRNRTIVLVDDVMTTGATIEACARALLDAGVRRVSAVTVARAVRARPAPRPR